MSTGRVRCRDDRGAATVTVVAGAAVLLAVTVAGLVVADLVGSRARAGAAADLAALAAAGAALDGEAEACARARTVASANRARLETCRLGGDGGLDADVVVSVTPAGPLLAVADRLDVDVPRVRARALAGPARSP